MITNAFAILCRLAEKVSKRKPLMRLRRNSSLIQTNILLLFIIFLLPGAAIADESIVGKQATMSKKCIGSLTIRGWLEGEGIVLVKEGTKGLVAGSLIIDGGKYIENPSDDEIEEMGYGHFLIKFAYPGNPNGEYGIWISSDCVT